MHVLASALALSVVESQNRGWVFLAVLSYYTLVITIKL